MLTIRKAQIDIMMQDKKATASLLIARKLRETGPFFQHYTDMQLQHWVSRQIDYLADLNIHEKDNVHSIIDIIALYGGKFERCADPSWALSIIENLTHHEGIRAILLQRAHKAYLKQFKVA